jgi:hypothetical protein
VADRAKKVSSTEPLPDLNGTLNVPFDLTPIQHMFLAATSSADYSQSFLLKTSSKIDNEAFREAFDLLVRRHPMLRARFQQDANAGSWSQRVIAFDPAVYSLTFQGPNQVDDMYEINANTRKALDMRTGPVFAANVFLNEQGSNQIVFLTAHHMIIDLVSWRIILRDLEEYLSVTNVRPKDEVHHLSFEAWARLQRDFVRRLPNPESQVATAVQPPDFSYWGMDAAPSTFDNIDAARFQLDSEVTAALLGRCNTVLSTEPLDIFLGVAIYAFAETFPARAIPTFFTESHGREAWHPDIDPSETVGWFTTMYPVAVPSGRPKNVLEAIAGAKDARRKFTDKGFAWFSSQFLESADERSPVRGGAVELIFNYFGMYQQLERDGSLFTPLNTRSMQPTEEGGAGTVRMSLLELDVAVYHGHLQVSLLFDRRMKHQAQLMAFMKLAQSLFEETAQKFPRMERVLTASDVPLMKLDYGQLGELVHTMQARTGLSAADVESMYPCTSMQEDLLASQAKGLGYYNTRLVWKAETNNVDGPSGVDSRRLASAWRQVCKRHAILRSILMLDPSRPGRWFQMVPKETAPSVELIDGPVQSLRDVLSAMDDEARLDFDAARPRHRLKIWQTIEGASVCQVDISHVLIDGAATEALIRDWMACYNGTARRQTPKFEAYVAFLQSHPRQQELDHWKRYTKGMPSVRFLPTEVSAQVEDVPRRLHTKQVMRVSTSALSRCCEAHQVTPACVFRAAWAMTMRKHGRFDEDEVVFGYLAHGRGVPVSSAQDIVGPMVVTLPFRARVTENASLRELLRQTQQDMVEGLGAQSISWGEVQHACASWNERPFDTLVNYRKAVDAAGHADASSEIAFTEIATYDPMEVSQIHFLSEFTC